jgi:hypothetical protein
MAVRKGVVVQIHPQHPYSESGRLSPKHQIQTGEFFLLSCQAPSGMHPNCISPGAGQGSSPPHTSQPHSPGSHRRCQGFGGLTGRGTHAGTPEEQKGEGAAETHA